MRALKAIKKKVAKMKKKRKWNLVAKQPLRAGEWTLVVKEPGIALKAVKMKAAAMKNHKKEKKNTRMLRV